MTKLGDPPWGGEPPPRGGRYDAAGNLLRPRSRDDLNKMNDAELDEAARRGWITWMPVGRTRRHPTYSDYNDLDLP